MILELFSASSEAVVDCNLTEKKPVTVVFQVLAVSCRNMNASKPRFVRYSWSNHRGGWQIFNKFANKIAHLTFFTTSLSHWTDGGSVKCWYPVFEQLVSGKIHQ